MAGLIGLGGALPIGLDVPARVATAAEGDLNLLATELSYALLLAIAAMVAMATRRLRLPYTVALVLAGLLLVLAPTGLLHVDISSQLFLFLLVPPLVFEATLHLDWRKFRRDLPVVLLLALGGSLIGTGLVAWGTMRLLGVPLAAALTFGALISATDPVAVVAFFRSLGVSKRLALIVEGESLLNDGIAIVLFTLALELAAGSQPGLGEALARFVEVAFGGLAIGSVLGYLVARVVLAGIDDRLVETLTTVALAYGSFAVAEWFHLSGILAVVAAGMFVGNLGLTNTSPTTRLSLFGFWELLAFAANSIVFLLIGLRIDLSQLAEQIWPVLVALLLVLSSRAAVVYLLTALHARLQPRARLPRAWRHVLWWGGLRGAISLALVLTLDPTRFPGFATAPALVRELQAMTFGVVLFTLLVQGTTIAPLIRLLRLAEKPAAREEQQRRQALLYARQAGRAELDRLYAGGLLAEDIHRAMAEVYRVEIERQSEDLREHLVAFPELEQAMVLAARAELLRAERSALGDAARRGLIDERVHDRLIREMDDRLAALELIRANRGGIRGPETPSAASPAEPPR
ncbi:MAG: Na+/H+ antiporter [Caldilineae bacterium]|nr:Na+/H+ antiporter [Caldilineae bacterium]